MTSSPPLLHPVKLGVVGLGSFGRLHAETIANLVEADLVALVDSDNQKLNQAAQDYPSVETYSEIESALANSTAQAWVVASSTASHVAIAERILIAGKTVLLEKPIAATLTEANRLAPLIAEYSQNLMMGHILLFNSEFKQLQQELSTREPFAYLDCVRHRPTTILTDFPGESPFHLTMVHDLYMAYVLKNREQPASISAQIHHTQQGQCDLALAQLQWSDGTLASFTASFMTPAGLGTDGYDRLEVFGLGWAARIQANPRPLELWDEKAHWPMSLEINALPDLSSGMLAEQLRCFCRVVHGKQAVPIGATYQDALQIQSWLEQMEAAVS